MAKKLHSIQLSDLATRLRGTRKSVYRVYEIQFGSIPGDEIFDQLRDEAGLKKCIECNVWKDMKGDATLSVSNLCEECDMEMFADE